MEEKKKNWNTEITNVLLIFDFYQNDSFATRFNLYDDIISNIISILILPIAILT